MLNTEPIICAFSPLADFCWQTVWLPLDSSLHDTYIQKEISSAYWLILPVHQQTWMQLSAKSAWRSPKYLMWPFRHLTFQSLCSQSVCRHNHGILNLREGAMIQLEYSKKSARKQRKPDELFVNEKQTRTIASPEQRVSQVWIWVQVQICPCDHPHNFAQLVICRVHDCMISYGCPS